MTDSLQPTKSSRGEWRHTLAVVALLVLSGSILTGCGGPQGVEFIARSDLPSADSVRWSRTNAALFLVNSSEMSFGFEPSTRVFILNRMNGQRRPVASTSGEFIFAQTWSPDGREVVLQIPRGASGYENYQGLWIWNSDTGSLEYLAAKGIAVWSPDGRQIAIVEDTVSTGRQTLRLIDRFSGEEQTSDLASSSEVGYVAGADWSPDGKRLALAIGNSAASIPLKLYQYELSSHQLLLLVNSQASQPAWSPDGDKMAYVEQGSNSRLDRLHIFSIPRQCELTLSQLGSAWSPSWSPDGKKLAYVGNDGIYAVDLEAFLTAYDPTESCLKF